MSFRIDPCKAVNKKNGVPSSLSETSNLCYGICDAFGNPEGCKDKCSDMLNSQKLQSGGSLCNLNTPKSVQWLDIPRYFPKLLEKTKNVEKAYLECCIMAKMDKYPNSTREMCQLDASAVVEPEKYEKYNQCSDDKISNTFMFYLSMFLVLFLFIIVLCSFLTTLFRK